MRSLLGLIAAGALAAASMVFPAAADERVTPLLKEKLHGMEEMEANIAMIDIDPGHETERHIHPGHVFIYVLEGQIEIDADGQEPKKISAGEAAYELPDVPMVGRNLSSTEGARIVVFQVGETGKPVMVPVN